MRKHKAIPPAEKYLCLIVCPKIFIGVSAANGCNDENSS